MLNYSEIDSILRALVEPTRRQILERLSRGPATVSQLAEPFGMLVTFAPLGQTGIYAPIRASVGTQIGPLTIRAGRFEAVN